MLEPFLTMQLSSFSTGLLKPFFKKANKKQKNTGKPEQMLSNTQGLKGK